MFDWLQFMIHVWTFFLLFGVFTDAKECKRKCGRVKNLLEEEETDDWGDRLRSAKSKKASEEDYDVTTQTPKPQNPKTPKPQVAKETRSSRVKIINKLHKSINNGSYQTGCNGSLCRRAASRAARDRAIFQIAEICTENQTDVSPVLQEMRRRTKIPVPHGLGCTWWKGSSLLRWLHEREPWEWTLPHRLGRNPRRFRPQKVHLGPRYPVKYLKSKTIPHKVQCFRTLFVFKRASPRQIYFPTLTC